MAITTLSGASAGMRQARIIAKDLSSATGGTRFTTHWMQAGSPPAGSHDTTLNGVALTAPVTGQIPYTDAVSASSYLGRLQASYPCAASLYLCDRLWHNGGYTITSTSAQNSTTPTWPARDANGSTNGDGVLLGLEISATVGSGTPTITIAYTNSAGTGSRSATGIIASAASSAAASFYPIGLQAGDTGVRSVQSLTLSATWTR